ncbi:glycosyltransferase family 25 protein [Rhizobacter sp. P5_C2]
MQCFVINLVKDVARREQITAGLQRQGLDHELFPAVLGDALTDEAIGHAYDAAAAARCRHPMTRGEIGCALSHLGVYQQVVERGLACALVLEDDARPGDALPQVLAAIEPLMQVDTPLVVLLNCVKLTSYFASRRLDAGHLLAPVLDGTWGAHAYVINQAAARSLLHGLRPVRLPADIWDEFRREKLATIRAVVPYCVGLSELAAQSNLGAARAAPTALARQVEERGIVHWLHRYAYRKFIYQLFVRPFIRRQVMTW